MSRIDPAKLADSVVVDGANPNFDSGGVRIANISGCGFHAVWDGTLAGTFAVETRIGRDNTEWAAVDVTISDAAGAAGDRFVNISQLMGEYVRMTFTRTAGAGNMSVWFVGKSEGEG